MITTLIILNDFIFILSQFFLSNMVACGFDLSFEFAWITDGPIRNKFISEIRNNSTL